METFSALLAICAGNSPVPSEFHTQRPVARSFDVFFDLRLNKRLSKQSWGWWFETLSCPIWRNCNGSLQGCHISAAPNHRQLHSLFNCVFRRTSNKTPKALCYRPFVRGIHQQPVESPTQRASNMENVYISWRLHGNTKRQQGHTCILRGLRQNTPQRLRSS